MKINLISPVDPLLTPAQQILINRGMTLEDANHLLNTTDDDIQNYSDLINMSEAVDTFLKHMKKDSGSKVVVQVDADVDGYTSAALIINYVHANYPHIDIDFQVHPQKAHGLIMSEAILQNKYDLVIVPDAGSGEYDKHKELKELNIDCIVLDHHEVDWDSPDAIVVNNQLSPHYQNKELSGVGVVWQFCRALDDSGSGEGKVVANDYLDLVALGLQADMMDLRSLETTHLIQKGLKLMNSGMTPNPFVRQIIDMQSYSLGPEVTPVGISFYIAPLINAVVRVGTLEERELIFKCFLDKYAHNIVPSTKQGEQGQTEKLTIQGSRLTTNIRNRQRTQQNNAAEELTGHIDDDYLEDNSIIVVRTGGSIVKDLNGLVANQVKGKYERPVLVLSEDNGKLSGSGRGFESPVMEDFREFIRNSGFAEYAEGHDNAFGTSFTMDNFEKFIEYANEELDFAELTHETYDVDFVVEAEDLTSDFISNILQLRSHWGEGLDEAYIAINNVPVSTSNKVLMGSEANPTLKIEMGAIPAIKFRPTQEELDSLAPNDYTTTIVDLVAKTNLNIWKGRETPQLFISEFKVVDTRVNF